MVGGGGGGGGGRGGGDSIGTEASQLNVERLLRRNKLHFNFANNEVGVKHFEVEGFSEVISRYISYTFVGRENKNTTKKIW